MLMPLIRDIKKIILEYHDNVSCMNREEIKLKLEKQGFICNTVEYKKSPFGYLFACRK